MDGIVGNEWYDPATIDWASGKRPEEVYCVSDPETTEINSGGKMSARNLQVTTLGDELKLATAGKGKVVGVAFKDRAAILMAGHGADAVVWTNGKGGWSSTSYFCPSGALPVWVDKLNADKTFDMHIGQAWEPLLPADAYSLTKKAPAEKAPTAGQVFSHDLGSEGDKSFYSNLATSGFGNDVVEIAVERAVAGEALGQDDVPDLLVVNLSSNDYVGHRYGPDSPEVMDTAVRTDRMLSRLFNFLDRAVPGGLAEVTIVVTADHGVLPIPEESAKDVRTGVRRVSEAAIEANVDKALSAKYGEAKWCWLATPNLYLNRPMIESKKLDPAEVQRVAAAAAMTTPGVYAALTQSDVWAGRVPKTHWAEMASNSLNPKLSGDVLVFEAAGDYMGGGTGTGHGSPWIYDSHVPILVCGKGIAKGRHSERVYTNGIAATLAHLLHVEYPSGCIGHILPGALKD